MKRDRQQLHGCIKRLREALEGLLGTSTRQELTRLAGDMLASPAPNEHKLAALNAIQALLAVMEVYEEPKS